MNKYLKRGTERGFKSGKWHKTWTKIWRDRKREGDGGERKTCTKNTKTWLTVMWWNREDISGLTVVVLELEWQREREKEERVEAVRYTCALCLYCSTLWHAPHEGPLPNTQKRPTEIKIKQMVSVYSVPAGENQWLCIMCQGI